jgi:hypothetical protein
MTTYKIRDDVTTCQSLTLDIEDFLDLLDPHIGESRAMLLGQENISIKDFWEPLALEYYQNEGTVDLADISMWRAGIILMNQKAYDAIGSLLLPHGEFLPCTLHGGPAYLFNCLALKPYEAANIQYRMHQGLYAEVDSIVFQTEDELFKHNNKISLEMYCSQELASAIEKARLKGLLFS